MTTFEMNKTNREIERLERELEKSNNQDNRNEIIEELNWYNEQYYERY